MSRDVVIIGVPSYLTLSEMLKPLEEFGQIVKAGIDEKRRKYQSNINIFVTFADTIGSTRALNKKHMRIEGSSVEIQEVKQVRDDRRYGLVSGTARRRQNKRPRQESNEQHEGEADDDKEVSKEKSDKGDSKDSSEKRDKFSRERKLKISDRLGY